MVALRFIPVGAALVTGALGLFAGCGGGTTEAKPTNDATKTTEVAPKPAETTGMPNCDPGSHAEGGQCVPNDPPVKAPATATPVASAPPPPPEPASPCPTNMVLIKGGKYKMGFSKNEVTVADFCMDKTEATAKDYEACVNNKKCTEDFIQCAPEATYKKAGKEDHPIVCVDFKQAVDYCTAQGKRLPVDEEWEWAARGGDEGRTYPWGNDAPKDQLCWSGAGTRAGTCPVAEHPTGASKDGLLGMAGNVFEWTTSRQYVKPEDRQGRGSSWRDGLPNAFRTDRPGTFKVTYRCGFLGVRCALAPSTPK